MTRFAVIGSIDERLLELQENKRKSINSFMEKSLKSSKSVYISQR